MLEAPRCFIVSYLSPFIIGYRVKIRIIYRSVKKRVELLISGVRVVFVNITKSSFLSYLG